MKTLADKILSYDQYAQLEKQGFPMPYVVEVGSAGQQIVFYGAEHSNDPKHPQFQDIQRRWKAFVRNAPHPLALVEGHFDEIPESETTDRTQSILQGGEAQLVVHLARRDDVVVVSPEPDRVWEATELAKEFGRDNVVLYYFVRQLNWWNKLTQKPDVQREAVKMLQLMQNTYNWQDIDFSIEGMDALHQKLFKKPLPWNDTKWIYDLTTPATHDHTTNELARRSGELRDAYILEQVVRYWREGKSLFAVFGAAHAVRLEPALRKLVSITA